MTPDSPSQTESPKPGGTRDDGFHLKATVQGDNPQEAPKAEDVNTLVPLAGLTDQEFQDLATSVLVLIPYCRGEGINPGISTHFGMWGRIGLRVGTVEDPSGGFLEVQRGGLVKLFREYAFKMPELKYMVMIDNDQAIEWDAPLRLAKHGLPIVSGVVCNYNPVRGIFACFTAADENGIYRFPSFRDTKFLPSEGLIEAGQVGTGLICIRRDVLDKIIDMGEQPFFLPEEIRIESVAAGALKKTEDIIFCEKAMKYGFKTYVDLSVHAIHYKRIGIVWPATQVDDKLKAIDWKPSPFDYKGVI